MVLALGSAFFVRLWHSDVCRTGRNRDVSPRRRIFVPNVYFSQEITMKGHRLLTFFLLPAWCFRYKIYIKKIGIKSENSAIFSVFISFSNFIHILQHLPFIMFPSAITNSMAVLLLPSVAQAQADGNQKQISAAISMALRYSLYMGILCTGLFCLYGLDLGSSVFQSPSAGAYIRILGWLCPFMNLATTLGSILNGLGKTSSTFLQNVCALCLRLVFVLLGIPVLGMKAYLWGILVSEMFLAFWHMATLRRLTSFTWDAADMLGKPVIVLFLGIWLNQKLWQLFMTFLPAALEPGAAFSFFGTAMKILTLCGFYGSGLLLCHLLRRE